MVVVDPQCFVGSQNTNARDAMPHIPSSGCSVTRPTAAGTRLCTIDVAAGINNEYGLSWMYQTQDASSAVTGTSVFDFQGDLKAEVLYNDECFFRVFEGSDASILYERPNSHRTATEYPIVVDVDGDGNSEIVVVSTGDQAVGRDRCGTPTRAGTFACTGKANGNAAGQCGADANCRFLDGACIPTQTFLELTCSGTASCTGASVANCPNVKVNGDAICQVSGGKCWPNGNGGTDGCNNTPGCQNVSGVCAPYAYYRDVYQNYKSTGCDCTDHVTQGDCNAGRGCVWSTGSNSCGLVGAAGAYCSGETTIAGCVAKSKDCLWDPYSSVSTCAPACATKTTSPTCTALAGCAWNGTACAQTATSCGSLTDCSWSGTACLPSGMCEQHPRDQDYICQHATWGVTSFGDTSNKWVRTLPYWHEHDYHITNTTRSNDPVPDFNVCYDNQADGDITDVPACAAIADATDCAAYERAGDGTHTKRCTWGESNPKIYNNFRQNVPGFVPLNAADLQVTELVADIRACPPTITLIATVFNGGRAGAPAGVPVGFYRETTSETVQQTAGRTDYVDAPNPMPTTSVGLLPGQTTHVEITFTLGANDVPINLAYRAVANPAFEVNQNDGDLECNANNNSADVSNIDCVDTGS